MCGLLLKRLYGCDGGTRAGRRGLSALDRGVAHAAGAHGVLVNLPENPWPALSSGYAEDCAELLRQLRLAPR